MRPAVRRYAGQFIRRKLKLTYDVPDCRVLTDEKWLRFVIEQVLSNALKYTRSGGVTITLEPERTLVIADTGIGIAPEDLPGSLSGASPAPTATPISAPAASASTSAAAS